MRSALAFFLLGAVAAAMPMRGIAAVPTTGGAAMTIAPDRVRSDFALLYTTLQQAHYDLFAHRSKADYDHLYHALGSTIDAPMTPVAVAGLFQQFVAYGRIGHARIDAPIDAFVTRLQGGGRLIPLFVRVDGDRVLLTEAAEGSGTLAPGTQIVAIDGEPVHHVIDRLGRFVSAERQYMVHAQLERIFPALLWLDNPGCTAVEVVAVVEDKPVKAFVPALTLAQRRALAAKFPKPGTTTNFSTREYRPLGNGIAYLRPGPFFNLDKQAAGSTPSHQSTEFAAFINSSFASILASGASDLILDLRDNPGGDNSFSDPVIAWFATRPFRFSSSFLLKASAATKADYARQRAAGTPIDPDFARQMAAEDRQPDGTRYAFELPMVQPRAEPRFHGRVWALVNRHSYSNAASVAALIQDYRFGKVIGEETADVASNYASVQSFTLPATRIEVTYPKSHFLRPSGIDEVAGVKPDIAIARPPIAARDDLVLDAAIAIIRNL